MKKFILAVSLAVAAIMPTYHVASAQSVIIEDGDGPRFHHRDRDRDMGRRDWDRRHSDRRDGWDRRRPRHDCTTERREIRRNGRTIIKETSNCR